MRVMVIGAGVVGACVSYRLAEAGVEVVTVEAGLPAGGTSGATFAWLNAFRKTPRDYFDLNHASMTEHRVLAEELGGGWVHFDGGLTGAWDEAAAAELGRTVERLRAWGYAVESITPDQAAEIEPDLDFSRALAVVHTPREGWAEVTPLVTACLRAAVERHGARVRWGTRVVDVRRTGERIAEVSVRKVAAAGAAVEWIGVDGVVLCAGPRSDEVARLAGLDLPLGRVPGLLAITAPAPTSLRHVVHGPGYHLRPDGGGRIMLGSEQHDQAAAAAVLPAAPGSPRVPGDGAELARAGAALLREGAGLLPALGLARVEAVRVGMRPMPPDGLPLIGPVPGAANVYAVVSHSGVTLGPLWGRVVAAELTGTPDPRLEPYRPGRCSASAARGKSS